MKEKKFQVLHIITRSNPFGGAQRNTWLSVSRASKMFPQTLGCGYGQELPELCKNYNVNFISLPHLKNEFDFIGDLKTFFQLYNYIKNNDFKIVHTHSSKAGFIGRIAAKLAGAPINIFSIHGVSFDFILRPRTAPILLWLEQRLSKITDGFISVAEFCKNEFVEKGVCPESKIKVIYSAIEYDVFNKATGKGKIEELGLNETDFIIGAIGHFRKAKGYEYLVETAKEVVKEIPNAKFVIIGDGEEREDIESLIEQADLQNYFFILGEREDVPNILKIFDVFVRSSIHEGLGRALTEALYVGLPCVATDICGTKEIVIDGETGYLVPVKDPKAMTEKIIFLHKNPDIAKRIGEVARKKVEKLFDANKMVKNIEDYYLELLKKKSLL